MLPFVPFTDRRGKDERFEAGMQTTIKTLLCKEISQREIHRKTKVDPMAGIPFRPSLAPWPDSDELDRPSSVACRSVQGFPVSTSCSEEGTGRRSAQVR